MKAILVVSFGTSVNETRRKTIEVVEMKIHQAYPDYKIKRAFTSQMIINKLKDRDNLQICTVEQAINQLILENCQELIIQPTHIINGIENDRMLKAIQLLEAHIPVIMIGSPLLTTTTDQESVITTLIEELPSLQENEAMIWMGHGSDHYINPVYAGLDYMLKEKGHSNIYIATVEAYPSLHHVIKQLPKHITKVYLLPFMLVAGEHALYDMAGEHKDSWSQVLLRKGYQVECIIKGLGEYAGIQQLYLDHISDLF